MKIILFIVIVLSSFLAKCQERSYSLLEVNSEYIVESSFNVIINAESVIIKPDTYQINSKKDDIYVLTKNGIIYQMLVRENNLTIKSIDNNSTLVFYKN